MYMVTLPWNPFALQMKTAAFLNAIQTQKYEIASSLFGGDIMDEQAWVDEMLKLYNNESFKLLSYDNVKADFDDGSFNTGHADLTFVLDGRPLKVRAIVTFSLNGKPKQICAIHPSETKPNSIPELAMWNRLVCGGATF